MNMRVLRVGLTVLVLFSPHLAHGQVDPAPCGDNVPCNQCSENSLGDYLRDQFNSVVDRLRDFFASGSAVHSASGLLIDSALDSVSNALAPDTSAQADFNAARAELQGALVPPLEQALRLEFAAGMEASRQFTLGARLPSGTDPAVLAPPDLNAFTSNVNRRLDFDAPSFGEARTLVDYLRAGNTSLVVDDLKARVTFAGLTVDGSLGNGWMYRVSGGVRNPLTDSQPGGELDLTHTRESLTLGMHAEKFEGQSWRWSLGISWHFSICTCCDYSSVSVPALSGLGLIALAVALIAASELDLRRILS